MAKMMKFVFTNGVVSQPSDTTSVTTLLQTHPGAYTTTRTDNNGKGLLFWDRHLSRLANSVRILYNSKPDLLFEERNVRLSFSKNFYRWDLMVSSLVNDSMKNVLPVVMNERGSGDELAVTALVSGNLDKVSGNEGFDEGSFFRVFDVYVHVGVYVPLVFGREGSGARLAVVGPGRDVADAKYSDWVRLRKPLEKLRPPFATELLLSNDGDRILEGCLTNFFVVCRKDDIEDGSNKTDGKESSYSVEIQTAPVSDGVLPGVVRQVIIEVCLKYGIPLREVAPSWSKRDLWEEAFITSSLRLLQHVETVQVPCSWESLNSKTWKEVKWEEKRFEVGPGSITKIIQKEIMRKAVLEGYPVTSFIG